MEKNSPKPACAVCRRGLKRWPANKKAHFKALLYGKRQNARLKISAGVCLPAARFVFTPKPENTRALNKSAAKQGFVFNRGLPAFHGRRLKALSGGFYQSRRRSYLPKQKGLLALSMARGGKAALVLARKGARLKKRRRLLYQMENQGFCQAARKGGLKSGGF